MAASVESQRSLLQNVSDILLCGLTVFDADLKLQVANNEHQNCFCTTAFGTSESRQL